ncbi:MAG: ATP synthase F1 subunit epsilon [Pseudomonadota bacterium]
MSEKFKVEVVTPKGVLLERDVEEVVAPGILGEFGVLKGHTSMLTFIKPGILSYLENDRFTRFVVGTGFCEVLKDSVTVLVDEAYSADEIDSAGAAQEVSALEKELEAMDSAANAELFEKKTTQLKVARAKVSLASGGGA